MKGVYKIYMFALLVIVAEWIFDLGPELLADSSCAWLGAVVGGVMNLAGGIAGTVMANKQAKKVDAQINKQQRKLDAWRDTELGSNYLDRADSREMLRRVAQHNEDQMKVLNTNAIKGGASEEAKVAAATQLNRNYADAIGSIASAGQRYRDMVQSQYMSLLNNLDNLRLQQLVDDSGAEALSKGLSGAGNVLAKGLSDIKIGKA